MEDKDPKGPKRKLQASVEDDDEDEHTHPVNAKRLNPQRSSPQATTQGPLPAATDTSLSDQTQRSSAYSFTPDKLRTAGLSDRTRIAGEDFRRIHSQNKPKPGAVQFLGGEVRLSLIPAMHREGGDYMDIIKRGAEHLDSLGQTPSVPALASAHHKAHGADFMLTASVMANAMENEMLKTQVNTLETQVHNLVRDNDALKKLMLHRLKQIADRVDTIGDLCDQTNALVIGSHTYDDLRENMPPSSAMARVPLAVKFSGQIVVEELD